MTDYRYLIPIVTLAPPAGFTLNQLLPLDKLRAALPGPDAVLRISRRVIRNGVSLQSSEHELRLVGNEWQNPEVGEFTLGNVDDNAWLGGDGLAFLETQIDLLSDGGFRGPFAPAFYSLYSGPGRKSFVSDNALKYGNTVTIYQIESFGQWVEGYPACEVDRDRDTDESIVLINPFARPTVANIEFEGRKETLRRRIDAQSGVRIDCASILTDDGAPWTGQIYVSGRNRLVVYFCKHMLSDPSAVTTLEHSDPYRGENASMPFTQYLRLRFGSRIKSLLGA
jgi:hypothetical protein